jgi:DNA-binding transcriptional LysR family regulator
MLYCDQEHQMADRRLQVFMAVAKHLSFTRAADDLFMSQPSVTVQIKQLEALYSTRLFERQHGSVSLTAAGEMVYSYAEKIMALSDEMESRLAEMSGELRGPLLIGASSTIAECLMPQLMSEFNALYPQVRACLIIANSDSVERRVAEHSLDLGLIEAPPKLAGLACDHCGGDELVVICAPDYPLTASTSIAPHNLVDYEYISREPGSGTREVTEAYFRKHDIEPDTLKTLMALGSPAALKSVVKLGLGFAIVSRLVVEQELDQELASLQIIPLQPVLKRSFNLIYPQDRFRSRLASTFIDFAKNKLRELVA